ncbi:MAG: TIGR04219 family outer membrane beta-barrel protein [Ketobacteraceae bacterium]|nr:TIGR04219 family outer membrane beta-barrel protein [Ketobacteraceae bacterium]
MKKTFITAAACLLAAPTVASADTIGFFGGAGTFKPEFSGTFKNSDTSDTVGEIDLEDDLGLDDDTATFFYVAIEHPVPLLPNIRLARTDMEQEGSTTLEDAIEFNGKTYDAEIESTIDLSHTDVTLYYELLDNWVNLDLGLTVRQFDGKLEITGREANSGQTETAKEDVDFPVPMLYAKAQFDLPFTGLYAAVDGNIIGYGGNSFIDATGKIGYETSLGFGVEAGLRTITLEIDDEDNLEADMDFSGMYLSAFYHF